MATTRKGAAARGEASGAPRTVTSHGLTLEIPAKLPFSLLRHMGGDVGPQQAVGVMSELLGEEQMQKVWDAGLDIDQGVELLEALLEQAGSSPGESEASPKP